MNPMCPGITREGVPCKLYAVDGAAECRHHGGRPYDGTLVNPGIRRCVECRKPWPCPTSQRQEASA